MSAERKRRLAGYNVGLTVALCILALSGALAPKAEAFRAVKEGAPAPGFTLKTVKGEPWTFSGAQPKATVIAFVRQGQEKSEKVLQALSKLDPALAPRVQVVAVVTNPSDGDLAAWAPASAAAFPVLVDSSQEVYGQYGVLVTPATGVVKPDGSFLSELAGYSASYADELSGLLQVALGLATEEQVRQAEEKAKVPETSGPRKMAERELEKARLLVARRMKDKAVESAKQAVKSDETYSLAHVVLGRLLLDASSTNADEALKHFTRALELSPGDPDARIGMARVKTAKGDHDGAVTILEEVAAGAAKPEIALYQLGIVQQQRGQPQKAAEAFRKALERILSD